MFYHRFCQLFGFTASLTCDKIEQILLNSLSTFYRLVWRSRQPEDKTLSSEKCFMTFYRRNNLQSVLEMFARCSTVDVCRRRSASAETLTANCSWVGSRGSSNHEIVLIFQKCRHHDIIPADTTQPKLFQIHKVLSHQLFPSPILFISSSAFIYLLCIFIFSLSSRFSLYTMSSCIPFVLFTLFFPHSLLSFSLSEVTSEATIMLLAINTPPSLLLSNRGSFFLALIL